ncbi:MAG: FUSC family protein [Acetobacteraceae bacterium]|nr:FUSC family protein [Acetobacteraceae bacterium]
MKPVAARIRTALGPITLTAVAAALSWLIAHRVLGHPQPFFAPIAAAVSLSTSRVQRFRRSVQLIGGVLLGIAIAQLLSSAIGISTVALGVIVFVALAIAVGAGAGFFAGGLMFANQAAASAILVVTLHKHGTGAERAVDALVGGGVTLVLGVGLFPAHPLRLLRDAERRLLAQLAITVEQAVEMLSKSIEPGADWAVAQGVEVHARVAELSSARATARTNVRIAPRRWRLRPLVEAELTRLSRFDALAEAVLGAARAAIRPLEGSGPLPITLRDELASIGAGMRRLASSEQRWPQVALDDVCAIAERIIARATSKPADRTAVVGSLLYTSALDLAAVVCDDRTSECNEL